MALKIDKENQHEAFSKHTITWKIGDQSHSDLLKRIKFASCGQCILSDSFRMFGLSWHLCLYPNGSSPTSKGEIQCLAFLHCNGRDIKSIQLNTKFTIQQLASRCPSNPTFIDLQCFVTKDNKFQFKSILNIKEIEHLDEITIIIQMQFISIKARNYGDISNLWKQDPSTAIEKSKEKEHQFIQQLHMQRLQQSTQTQRIIIPQPQQQHQQIQYPPTNVNVVNVGRSSPYVQPIHVQQQQLIQRPVQQKQVHTAISSQQVISNQLKEWKNSMMQIIKRTHDRVVRVEKHVKLLENMMLKMEEKMNERKKENDDVDVNIKQEFDEEKQRLKDWFKDKVKLPQYYQTFIMNGIENMNVVQLVGNKELIDIGIDTLGHRLRIMNEIKQLNMAGLDDDDNNNTTNNQPPLKKRKLNT